MERAIFVLYISSELKDFVVADNVGVGLAVDHFLNGAGIVCCIVK